MGDIRRTYCAFILGMCSDVDPLDKVTTNAFTLKKKKMFHKLCVSPAAIFVSLQQWTFG